MTSFLSIDGIPNAFAYPLHDYKKTATTIAAIYIVEIAQHYNVLGNNIQVDITTVLFKYTKI